MHVSSLDWPWFVAIFMGHENGDNKGKPGDDTCKECWMKPVGGGGALTYNVDGTGMCRPYGWVLGPKFSKQGSLFDRFSLNIGGFPETGKKLSKNG